MALRKFIKSLQRFRDRHAIKIMSDLPAFVPNSSGARQERARLTLRSAAQTFPLITQLLRDLGEEHTLQRIETLTSTDSAKITADKFKLLFDKHGSDKSTRHNYHHLYAAIMSDPNAALDILEIGLGTNNTDILSNMGRKGTPGASLKAFKEYLPRARIYGADVDRRILFEEDRIKTFYVDQTDQETFTNLERVVGHEFDLIIDDGLHAPDANIVTLLFALRNLKQSGWFVVEDIAAPALPIWEVVISLLSSKYNCSLLSAKAGYLFVLTKAKTTDFPLALSAARNASQSSKCADIVVDH